MLRARRHDTGPPAAIGTAVYGKNWKSAMAVDVYVSRITIDNWDIGRHPPPGDIGGRLLSALRARRSGERRLAKQRDAELGKLIAELEREAD